MEDEGKMGFQQREEKWKLRAELSNWSTRSVSYM